MDVRAGLSWMLGLIMAALALPAHADAGTYVVNSCAFPDGSPAPIDGWTYRSNYVGWSGFDITCQKPNAPERAIEGVDRPREPAHRHHLGLDVHRGLQRSGDGGSRREVLAGERGRPETASTRIR